MYVLSPHICPGTGHMTNHVWEAVHKVQAPTSVTYNNLFDAMNVCVKGRSYARQSWRCWFFSWWVGLSVGFNKKLGVCSLVSVNRKQYPASCLIISIMGPKEVYQIYWCLQFAWHTVGWSLESSFCLLVREKLLTQVRPQGLWFVIREPQPDRGRVVG